jgi:hypothetical protein
MGQLVAILLADKELATELLSETGEMFLHCLGHKYNLSGVTGCGGNAMRIAGCDT